MKCIVADWELRNLGCKTIELTIEKQDLAANIIEQIEDYRKTHDAKYVVVKVQSRNDIVNFLLQTNGFIWSENQLSLKISRDVAKHTVNRYRFKFSLMQISQATEHEEIEFILSEIKKNIFTTDRIAMDEYFGVNFANQRYALWLQDEFNRGSDIYFQLYKGKKVGFFVTRNADKETQDGILAGLFRQFQIPGFGVALGYVMLEHFLASDRKYLKASVSNNNISVLRLNIDLGYKIQEIENVYIKHFTP